MSYSYTTLSAAQTAFFESADYYDDTSCETAKKHRAACASLIVLLPAATADSGTSVSLSPGLVHQHWSAVRAWIDANSGTNGGVGHFDLSGPRT